MSAVQVRIICSNSLDPWYNLAFEEKIFHNLGSEEIVLFFYKNNNSIIIGRNQNPWKESKCHLLQKEGGKIARRFSGGGTVFHDPGNLNFSFIVNKKYFNRELNFAVIQKALQQWDISCQISERHDLFIEDKKISGNAFHLSRGKACHHGTLLFDVRLSSLKNYLRPAFQNISDRSTLSCPSPVINLKEINHNINIDGFIQKMKESFFDIYSGNYKDLRNSSFSKEQAYIFNTNPEQLTELRELYQKHSSWSWIFGSTPDFTVPLTSKTFYSQLRVKEGLIKDISCRLYSGGATGKLERKLKNYLLNQRFSRPLISKAVNYIDKSEKI